MDRQWTTSHLPDLSTKTAIVTGGNTGLGFESALALAQAGCTVVIGCRNTSKGNEAAGKIAQQVTGVDIHVLPLDLTCLASIKTFTDLFKQNHNTLDILLNNAGVVNLSELQHTQRGDEMHFATNHLGHFCLTGHLLPMILNTPHARVVTVSSGGYKFGEIRFDDLDWHIRPYNRIKAYGDSKLANMLFCHYLQILFDQNGINAVSLAAHPGLTASERQQTEGVGGILSKYLASPISCGVQPLLRACCDPDCGKGDLIGPKFGIRGKPEKVKISPSALDTQVAKALWEYSCQATDIMYDFEAISRLTANS